MLSSKYKIYDDNYDHQFIMIVGVVMRTTVSLPNDLFADIMRYTHAHSRTNAVNQALREWLRLRKLQQLKDLRGNLTIDDNIKSLRQLELKKLKEEHE